MESNDTPSLSKIVKSSLILIKKAILPIILYIFVLSILSGLIQYLLFDLTGFNKMLLDLEAKYNQIIMNVEEIQDFLVTDEDLQVQRTYPILFFLSSTIKFSSQMFMLIFVVLVTARKIVDLEENKYKNHTISWNQSFTEPFNNRKRVFTSLFFLLCGSILITAGLTLLIIPGVILMILFIFSIHSMLIDEKYGTEALKGGRFYARNNVAFMIILFTLSLFIPMILSSLYTNPLMNLINLSLGNYENWIQNPLKNGLNLLLYNFSFQFFQNIILFWFPIVISVAFSQFQEIKVKTFQNSQKSTKVDVSQPVPHNTKKVKVKKIAVKVGQNHYYCGKCGNKNPISSKKCSKCGQLFKLIYVK
ncbi:zinc ribbon domain-containing protein [Candidatus Lokiarchaeum ossiferum]|uniref:zinc ribbon domain-containing protein n=1 Tax=Candidatus Lokiarchaeum ossiferum TaxID=2951803 RepID=UPI00352D86A4